MKWILAGLLALTITGTAAAQSSQRMQFRCNLHGAWATLNLTLQQHRPRGVVFTAGSLTSSAAAYSFTGQNRYALFTNLRRHERFRVRFDMMGNNLRITANPHGRGPRSYMCQRTR